MKRFLLTAWLVGLAATLAQAHFVYIVPAKDGTTATVVLSDDLDPDDAVEIDKVAGLKLTTRTLDGKEAPLTSKADKHALAVPLPQKGAQVVYGSVPYGIMQRGDAKPFLLVYHPKTLIGNVPADKATVGQALPAELLPVVADGKLAFQFVSGGKPVADAEVNVLKPDGSKTKLKTRTDGKTEALSGAGRYAAWARVAEAKAGDLGGKKYEEVRHYPTLVVDVAK